MIAVPSFPPLWRGEPVDAGLDPFAIAVARGADGEPGTLLWSRDPSRLGAAVILAPELPLADAVGVVFAVALGLSDAIGALAPPEVAVEFVWPDRLMVNGAACGGLRASAPTRDPAAEPDVLVVGVEVPLRPSVEDEPGHRPGSTTLYDEGCGEIAAVQLAESWSRHMLVWINRFVAEGMSPVVAAWRARTRPTTPPGHEGDLVRIDDDGTMVLSRGGTTRRVPLTVVLDAPWPSSPEPSASTTATSTCSTSPPRSASGRSPARSSSPTGPTRT